MGSAGPNFRSGSESEVSGDPREGPHLGAEQTKSGGKQTLPLEKNPSAPRSMDHGDPLVAWGSGSICPRRPRAGVRGRFAKARRRRRERVPRAARCTAAGRAAGFPALSFVRSPNDVHGLKHRIAEKNGTLAVVAKIERSEALDEFDAILEATDAIMMARGDLGIEIPLHQVPQVQKKLITKCNDMGVPVITATQMLESIWRPRRRPRPAPTWRPVGRPI